MLCGALPTVHFILERTQCLQLRALPGGGHLQVRAALAQLLQVGLEPDGLLARFFPCEAGFFIFYFLFYFIVLWGGPYTGRYIQA